MPRLRAHILSVGAAVLYPLYVYRARRRRRGKGDAARPRILLIPQLTRIGDVICTTPVFRAVKERHPDAFLSVLVTPSTLPILKHNPHIDDLLVFEHEEYREFFGLFRLFKKVRDKHFDWSINIAASTFGTLAAVYGCVPRRVKIARRERPMTERLTDWMSQHRIRYRNGEYLPALYLKTLESLNVTLPERIEKEVFTTPEGDRKADVFLRGRAIVADDFVVGISISAGNSIKEWGSKKFAELARRIMERYPAQIVFIGTEKDKKRIDEVNVEIGGRGINAGGEFSLEELPSLMKRFSVFIASDSGTIHIADALGVPLIDIVGPVDPYEQTPRGKTSIIVKPPVYIKPSIFAFRPEGTPEEARRAADAISVKQVQKAFEMLYATITTR